jgi:hypothetical protein
LNANQLKTEVFCPVVCEQPVQFTVYKKSRHVHRTCKFSQKFHTHQILTVPDRVPQFTVMRPAASTTIDRLAGANTTFTCAHKPSLAEERVARICRTFCLRFSAGVTTSTGGKATVTQVGRAGSAPAGHFATNRQARFMAGRRVEKGRQPRPRSRRDGRRALRCR